MRDPRVLSTIDKLTMIQARVKHTLENGIELDLTRESCKKFLRRHAQHKISVVVLYVDIDGSTKMSMSIPASQFASILHVFSQEMSMLIEDYGGYVLKYVGDAVIALFPAEHDKREASKNAVSCANAMQEVVRKSINPELAAHGLQELSVKISLDIGELLVVQYGKSLRSHIDTVGATISMTSKMLSFAKAGQIIVGESLRSNLLADEQQGLSEVPVTSQWSYVDAKRGTRYRLYLISNRSTNRS
jgi:class 3 adenylate cyclase